MLKFDPLQRITAEAILDHSYFAEEPKINSKFVFFFIIFIFFLKKKINK